MELLVVKVESSKDVPDTIGSSFVGPSRNHVSIWSSLSRARDSSNLEVIVRSGVKTGHGKGSGSSGFPVGGNVDPNTGSGVSSVSNIPSGVAVVGPNQTNLGGGL